MDDIENKQLTWYTYIQSMSKSRLPKQVMNQTNRPLEERKTEDQLGTGRESQKPVGTG